MNNYDSFDEDPISLLEPDWKWVHKNKHHMVKGLQTSLENISLNFLLPEKQALQDAIKEDKENMNANKSHEVDEISDFIVESRDSNLVSSIPLIDITYACYSPSKEKPVLLTTFINLPYDQDKYIEFANKYGLIGNTLRSYKPYFHCENISFWQREIWMLKTAYILSTFINENNSKDLNKILTLSHPDKNNDRRCKFTLGYDVINYAKYTFHKNYRLRGLGYLGYLDQSTLRGGHNKNPRNYLLTGEILISCLDTIIIAKTILAQMINYYLLKYPVTATLKFDIETGKYHHNLTPSNLLSAMWYELLQIITGERKIKQCPICRQWSDVTNVKGSWTKHRDCANWDRVTKGRKLKFIKILFAEGKSFNEIANILKVDIHHIERWLKEDKEGEKSAVKD